MKMTIDEIIENLTTIRNKLCSRKYETESTLTFDAAIETMRKYQMFQADYNARLKADIVDMLTEIQSEIEKMEILASITDGHGLVMREDITALIQQKIDKLKEQTGENTYGQ